jgi:circadian clock protein KaiB
MIAVTLPATFRFRLYIAGPTANSSHAIANLRTICQDYLKQRYEIEIVDVFKDPDRALADGIMMTPTLLRLTPGPQVRIVGSLSATLVVLEALNIHPRRPDSEGVGVAQTPDGATERN